MCGISGFVSRSNNQLNDQHLQVMNDTLHHRGPDDGGVFFHSKDEHVIALAQRRLSIIDLSENGHQPMFFKNLTIVFNGEIYNYKEIRQTLIDKYGCEFNSNSDTEVILQAYFYLGKEAFSLFNGMFSIVIYDEQKDELIIVRDRAGVKPLYVYKFKEHLVFASELKAILKYPYFIKEINRDVLPYYFQYGYIPSPYCIYKNVYKVEPGSIEIYNISTGNVESEIYWDSNKLYIQKNIESRSKEDVLNELDDLLTSAFQYRMVSDVPVGIFLSGGYDSSIVTAILQKNSSQKIKTFSIGFDDERFNEAPYAKAVADFLGTEHHEHICTEKDALEIVDELAFYFDEPFGDSSAIPTILVSKKAKEHVTVSLSADAGDELFAGYTKHSNALKNIKFFNRIPTWFRKPLGYSLKALSIGSILKRMKVINSSEVYNMTAQLLIDGVTPENYNKISTKKISDSQLSKIWKSKLNTLSTFFDESKVLANQSDLSKILAVDYKTYLRDDILVKVDRATMSVSLEGREPFLDHRVLEFAAKLPDDMKIHNGKSKFILKELCHRYIPYELMNRPKAGFAIPLAKWLRNEFRSELDTYFEEHFIEQQSYFNAKGLIKIYNDFVGGNDDYYEFIWYYYSFQLWYKRWMLND